MKNVIITIKNRGFGLPSVGDHVIVDAAKTPTVARITEVQKYEEGYLNRCLCQTKMVAVADIIRDVAIDGDIVSEYEAVAHIVDDATRAKIAQ